jgi:hypothetical protein
VGGVWVMEGAILLAFVGGALFAFGVLRLISPARLVPYRDWASKLINETEEFLRQR